MRVSLTQALLMQIDITKYRDNSVKGYRAYILMYYNTFLWNKYIILRDSPWSQDS